MIENSIHNNKYFSNISERGCWHRPHQFIFFLSIHSFFNDKIPSFLRFVFYWIQIEGRVGFTKVSITTGHQFSIKIWSPNDFIKAEKLQKTHVLLRFLRNSRRGPRRALQGVPRQQATNSSYFALFSANSLPRLDVGSSGVTRWLISEGTFEMDEGNCQLSFSFKNSACAR